MSEHQNDRRSAVAAVAEAPSGAAAFAQALGGPRGMIESALPAVTFVTAYTVNGQDARLAAIIALGVGALMALSRLARRQTPQFALSGLAGLALAAFVVSRTGRAEDFFLPGLLLNAGYALAFLISIVVRWPLPGVLLGLVEGKGMGWRQDPAKVRTYARIAWVFVALFSLRLVVQLPLYLAGAVVALGVARVAMGVPLFAVGIWIAWLMLRAHLAEEARARPVEPARPAPATD